MNPLNTLPVNKYVTIHGHHGERHIGMQMSDGRWLVRDGDVIGTANADGVAGWSDLDQT